MWLVNDTRVTVVVKDARVKILVEETRVTYNTSLRFSSFFYKLMRLYTITQGACKE